jgi:transcriptional adapter 2-alpha
MNKIKQNIGYIPFSENNKQNRSVSKNNIKKDDQDKNKHVNQNVYDILGYWEKRKDYDVEFKNEAEIQMSEIEFHEKDINDNIDNKEEININYKNLKNYNNILDEREERKKLIIEKNLFDVRKQINFSKRLSKQDREIFQILRFNLKYLTKEQFLFIFDSNVLEKNIKARLNQLLYYKSLGCNTYDEITKYINEIKKEQKKNKEENEFKQDDKMRLRNSTIISTNKLSEIQKNNDKKKKNK